jgi:hypothetical protein
VVKTAGPDENSTPRRSSAVTGDGTSDSWRKVIADAAIEAEFDTGRREETVEEARRHVVWRVLSIVGGFTLIALGIAALPLPGPGWLIILLGLSLLPFKWAERTIVLIRRRIPGVPEEGSIPARTWLVMGAVVVTFSVAGALWGADLMSWVSQLWGGDQPSA